MASTMFRLLHLPGKILPQPRQLSSSVSSIPRITCSSPTNVTDEPVQIMDPYKRNRRKCMLCVHNIELDYKNVRLLSQFVSPYTGRIYGRHITGLCIPMQKRISQLITRSRQFGFMPFENKETVFMKDARITNSPS
ncbi:hypothetical protein CRM22_006299 [Opisthorchis felineus]|uniref:Ribosomal protein S18 n=1 Tax=Opisthorchis felineus TaxID=147828 RepID=A0A4S2LU08_OPIFE|nr:hypothetical protein CRM22_006299 [Opisthorchis felineus]